MLNGLKISLAPLPRSDKNRGGKILRHKIQKNRNKPSLRHSRPQLVDNGDKAIEYSSPQFIKKY